MHTSLLVYTLCLLSGTPFLCHALAEGRSDGRKLGYLGRTWGWVLLTGDSQTCSCGKGPGRHGLILQNTTDYW